MKHVVAAVGILQRANHTVFIQKRSADNHYYPDYYEFPGGKVENNETPKQAVLRELKEEIGITATDITPWLVYTHQYTHANVTLHVFRVWQWQGEPDGCEGQDWQWQAIGTTPPKLLDASICLWKWLTLPPLCIVSAAVLIGVENTIAQLPQVAAQPILLQLRDKKLPADARQQLAVAMQQQVLASGGLLVINDDETLARQIGAAGVHLSAARLMACAKRPPFEWVGASCHNAAELTQAEALTLDYAVLSPVNATLTHVNATPIGWDGFGEHTRQSSIPLYALGGMEKEDIATAIAHGGHGIAMMRRGWNA
ncbi:MAG: Nudix family hydrolase [Proteobacteria bacterium]|nr:Nudix family hydrolase [Pseudomonadota bacterium]